MDFASRMAGQTWWREHVRGPLPLMGGYHELQLHDVTFCARRRTAYRLENTVRDFTDLDSRYSEVYWTMQKAVPLPPGIVKRFRNKVIAIRGYEVDQVRTLPNGTDVPVPITHAYNHHYCAWLVNSNDKVKEELHTHWHNHSHRWDPLQSPDGYSLSEFFSEGNGGEFRGSYHGYPRGYAQLLESPDLFHFSPMQIDTWNRSMGHDTALFHPGPLPKASRIPHSAGYSGLIECPCSDDLPREWAVAYSTTGCDGGAIANVKECVKAARLVVPSLRYNVVDGGAVGTAKNCSVVPHEDGTVDVLWNARPIERQVTTSDRNNNDTGGSDIKENKTDGSRLLSALSPQSPSSSSSLSPLVAFASMVSGDVNVTIVVDESDVSIHLTGPSDRWFGVAFGSLTMCIDWAFEECFKGGPYAIVVEGDTVSERKLDQHGRGHLIESTVVVESNTIVDGHRLLVLKRSLPGKTDEHYTFSRSDASIDMIAATGCGVSFGPHCEHSDSRLMLLAVGEETGLCRSGIEGSIGGQSFSNKGRCAEQPISDLVAQHNPTCKVQTYRGGLTCCRHGQSLLDNDQDIPWEDQYLEYRFKFRFYFEEYQPATTTRPPSHGHLTRVYWQTESFAGEYDIPQCSASTPRDQCVHSITSRFQVHQAVWGDMTDMAGVKLIYAGPHCHAPTCLSMDLWNADTGELLCHVEPVHGGSGGVYEEHGFLAIPPCLWGSVDDGLVEPVFLSLNTTLLSVKQNNNSLPHTGEMASWQMRGLLVPQFDDEESVRGVEGGGVQIEEGE